MVKWDGQIGFRLPLRGKCKCGGIAGGELLVQLNGEVPVIPPEKEDYGSDLYAACRTAVSSGLRFEHTGYYDSVHTGGLRADNTVLSYLTVCDMAGGTQARGGWRLDR